MAVLKSQDITEKNSLLVFQSRAQSLYPEPPAPFVLHAQGIFKHLSAIVAPLTVNVPGSKLANVSAIAPLPDLA